MCKATVSFVGVMLSKGILHKTFHQCKNPEIYFEGSKIFLIKNAISRNEVELVNVSNVCDGALCQ
jgi:hypothetical protein